MPSKKKVVKSPKPIREASGYVGGTPSINRTHKALTFMSLPKSEDTLTNERERTATVLECEFLYRNNALLKAGCDQLLKATIGPEGLKVIPKSSNLGWNKLASQYFTRWEMSCDIRGRSNFRQFQEQSLLAKILSGDILFVKYDNYKLQPIESLRVATHQDLKNKPSNVTSGIETNALGQITKFHVCPRDERGNVDCKKATPVDADKCIYLANIFRPDQLRGIPVAAPALPLLMDTDELGAQVLRKAKLEAQLGVKYTLANFPIANDGVPTDDATGEAGSRDGKLYEYHNELNNYTLRAGAGEDVSLIKTDYPSPNYEPFSRFLILQISACLGIPDSLLLYDFSKSRVTSSKPLLQQFYNTIDVHQQWLYEQLILPVWKWVIGNAILENKLPPAPKDGIYSEFDKIEIAIPERLLGDPKNEAVANEMSYKLGTTSVTRISKSMGYEIKDTFIDRKNELMLAYTLAEEMNKEAGKPIFTFRDFISTGTKQEIVTDDADVATEAQALEPEEPLEPEAGE